MTGMTLGRIPAPENQVVGTILHLAKRAGHFAHSLEGNSRGAVTHARGGVDDPTNPVGDRHSHALRFGRGVTETIGQRKAGREQDVSGPVHRLVVTGRLAIDQRLGPVLDVMIEEPGLSKHTGVFRLRDPVALNGQLHVVTDTPTKRTGSVLDNPQLGSRLLRGRR